MSHSWHMHVSGLTAPLKVRATRPPAPGWMTSVRARQGANTPLPLRRSPPASFKRLLGSSTPAIKLPTIDERDDENEQHHDDAANECRSHKVAESPPRRDALDLGDRKDLQHQPPAAADEGRQGEYHLGQDRRHPGHRGLGAHV